MRTTQVSYELRHRDAGLRPVLDVLLFPVSAALQKLRRWHGPETRVTVKVLALLGMPLVFANSALAAPTQQEVFKSIQDNVGSSTDPRKFFAFMAAIVALVILLAVLSKRKQREVSPKTLNHQGKLLREIVKQVDLRPTEIRQLKMLAEAKEVSSPLTLLLCPSVLAEAVKDRAGKVDRKVMMGVAKKLS